MEMNLLINYDQTFCDFKLLTIFSNSAKMYFQKALNTSLKRIYDGALLRK